MRTIGNTEKFYLAMPIDTKVEFKTRTGKIASLDPGKRIFQTIYDNQGNSYLIGGNNDIEKLDRLSRAASRMRSGIKRERLINGKVLSKEEFKSMKENGTFKEFLRQTNKKTVSNSKKFTYRKARNAKEKESLRKAARFIESKIKNKIIDIHRKTVKFLCDNYDTVIIPEFRVAEMVKKKNDAGEYTRKLGKETTRKLTSWSHYTFRRLLIAKGAVTGTNVVIGTEEWTSKTCGNCGYRNLELGASITLDCQECGCKIHRDINAARNIMILNYDRINK
jgi:transposase